jgi:hypothetical protein
MRHRVSGRYKGVYLDRRRDQGKASITSNDKRIWLGYFDTDVEAALAFNVAALEYDGEFAWLNEIVSTQMVVKSLSAPGSLP